MMGRILIVFIKIYAYLISPLTGPSCRFHPTCSAYAVQAIQQFGAGKGGLMAARRILKCHPWRKGPFHDPVPPRG